MPRYFFMPVRMNMIGHFLNKWLKDGNGNYYRFVGVCITQFASWSSPLELMICTGSYYALGDWRSLANNFWIVSCLKATESSTYFLYFLYAEVWFVCFLILLLSFYFHFIGLVGVDKDWAECVSGHVVWSWFILPI